MSSIYHPKTEATQLYQLRREFTVFRNIAKFQNSPINVDSSGVGLMSSQTPNAVTQGTQVLQAVVHTVTKDASNLYHAIQQAPTVIVQDVTQGANVVLHYLDQMGSAVGSAIQKGINATIAFVRGLVGQTVTLKKAADMTGTTGNFAFDSDIVMAQNQQVILQWNSSLGTSGMWTVAGGTLSLASGGGSGANTALSNLITTAINQDLIFGDGTAPNAKNIRNVDTMYFKTTGATLKINSSGDGTVLNFSINNLANVIQFSSNISNGGVIEVLSQGQIKAVYLATGNNLIGSFNYDALNSASQQISYVVSYGFARNTTHPNESGELDINIMANGSLTNFFQFAGSALQLISLVPFVVNQSGVAGPLVIDTLGQSARYACGGGHLFQNASGSRVWLTIPSIGNMSAFGTGVGFPVLPRANQSYTIDSLLGSGTDYVVTMNDNTFTRNVTLPDATLYVGRWLVVKNVGSKLIGFVTVGGQTVDGFSSGTYTLGQYNSAILFSDGSNWLVAGKV